MNISPIKSQRDYRNVLKEIEGLMNAKRNTPEGDRLDVLVTLVEMDCSLATSFLSPAVATACTRC